MVDSDYCDVAFDGVPGQFARGLAALVVGHTVELPSREVGHLVFKARPIELAPGLCIGNVYCFVWHAVPGCFDFEVSFLWGDVPAALKPGLGALLQAWAAALATRFSAQAYYAGMEPADCEATQFFNGPKPGPWFNYPGD